MNSCVRAVKWLWELLVPSDPEIIPEPYGELHQRILAADSDWRAWQLAFDWLNVNYPEPGTGIPYENYLRAWEIVANVKERTMGES